MCALTRARTARKSGATIAVGETRIPVGRPLDPVPFQTMSDVSERAVGAASRSGAIALAAATGQAIAGNLGALAAASIGEGVAALFGALAMRNDDAIHAWRLGALEEEMIKLKARFDKLENELASSGTKPDRTDPISVEQTFSQFAKDVTVARSIVKREALVNAAAGMHDPRVSGAATRAYWYNVLRGLSDLEVCAIKLVSKYAPVASTGTEMISGFKSRTSVDLGGEDLHTMSTVMHALVRKPTAEKSLEEAWLPEDLKNGPTAQPMFVELSRGGVILAKLIAD